MKNKSDADRMDLGWGSWGTPSPIWIILNLCKVFFLERTPEKLNCFLPNPFQFCLNKILKNWRKNDSVQRLFIVHSIVLRLPFNPFTSKQHIVLPAYCKMAFSSSLYFRIHSRGMLGLLAVSSRIKFYLPLRKDIKASATFVTF